ncbi:Magnesium transporter [Phaffia rhodozyma]|uniref:Magnesium transporter n=1 Tax=Phaffia rhodozyma TaxID=264483 RepID=A0A0F7SN34_PHARH|nr:Magnesium transporter [Phaffia rhodozyma]
MYFLRLAILASIIVAAHAAYSAYEYLGHLKALDRPETTLPLSIKSEATLALLVFLLAHLQDAASLKKIGWSDRMQKLSIDETDAKGGFIQLRNRGSQLFSETGLQSSST